MGATCCVAARDRTLPNITETENIHRNVACSPSWSFHRDNRSRVAGEIDDMSLQGVSRDISMELKGALDSEDNSFHGGTLHETFGTPASQKSAIHEEIGRDMTTLLSDTSTASNYSVEVKNLTDSPDISDLSAPKLSFSVHSPFSTPTADSLSVHAHPLPPTSTPSRRACRSPGHRLLRQISDSRILGLKSPNNYSLSEGRSSFVYSACSNDLTTSSLGGSSDGWSMRTFSELVASSQRERWSFDSDNLVSGHAKINGSSSRFSCSPSIDLQTCGACLKYLSERTSWSGNELSVVAVLVCGHVYHAECLETMTLEVDRYDPACPICMVGEKQVSKMSTKALRLEAGLKSKSHKIPRNRVVDSYLDGGCDGLDHQILSKQDGKAPKTEPSSSARPFLRRHFSLGSKWSRSLSDNESAGRKGFWARYRKA